MTAEPQDRAALDHVLVLAPYRRDADYLRQLLSEQDLQVRVCPSGGEIADCLEAAPGVLVATHEALTPDVIDTVAAWLSAQPTWSEVPIVVLLDRSSDTARVKAALMEAWPRARQLFYQRPVAPVELVSGVQTALLARLRQREVRDHIDREVELRRELNHRVKNILASVASIFEMTRRGAGSLEAFAEDFRGRLGALSDVHSAVFQAEGEAVPLQDVVDLTFAPYQLSGTDRVRTGGPVVLLSREAGTTLALCLHELATNAIKYGALSRPEGKVSFLWQVTDGALSACWEERGGPVVVAPDRSGYGTRYLRSALASLFGEPPILTFAPEGLTCAVKGHLSRVSRNA